MAARKTPDPQAKALMHLKKAEATSGHLAGHLLVMHHLNVAHVNAVLGNKAAVERHLKLADAEATSDAYKARLSDPVYVHDYELAKAHIQAALARF